MTSADHLVQPTCLKQRELFKILSICSRLHSFFWKDLPESDPLQKEKKCVFHAVVPFSSSWIFPGLAACLSMIFSLKSTPNSPDFFFRYFLTEQGGKITTLNIVLPSAAQDDIGFFHNNVSMVSLYQNPRTFLAKLICR